MNKKEKEPEKAVTASASDSFEVTPEEIKLLANKNSVGTYYGEDGDRLFTRNEVTIILRKRIDRYRNSLLDKYGISSFEDLDNFVYLAKKVTSAVDDITYSKNKPFEYPEISNFKNAFELNAYLAYYNEHVCVPIERDNSLHKVSSEGVTFIPFLFCVETFPDDQLYITMKYSDFVAWCKRSNIQNIKHFYGNSSYLTTIEANNAFTKHRLDEFLNRLEPQYRKQYDFLFAK